MEVKIYGAAIDPLRDLIRDIRERTEEFFFFLKHLITAAVTLLESLMVELFKLIRDALLEFCEGVVYIVPAPGDDGGCNLSDRSFY